MRFAPCTNEAYVYIKVEDDHNKYRDSKRRLNIGVL